MLHPICLEITQLTRNSRRFCRAVNRSRGLFDAFMKTLKPDVHSVPVGVLSRIRHLHCSVPLTNELAASDNIRC
jgi:hypothetical protein